MGTYTPYEFRIPNGLDERGLRLGLQRLPAESLSTYRRRLLAEARDASGPEQFRYIRTLDRRVGAFDVPVFSIAPKRDANNIPLTDDPHIAITSSRFKLYYDWENDGLEIDLDIVSKSGARFLRDVYTVVAGSSYFDITILDTDYTYKRSANLKYDTSERFQSSEAMLGSRSVKLKRGYIRNIYPQALQLFETEVNSLAAVNAEGKFYVDYVEGVVFTFEYGRGLTSYSYREFPYVVVWQPVRAWPYNDADKIYKYYDTLISDSTGQEEYTLLNSRGAEIADRVIQVHPLGWGE